VTEGSLREQQGLTSREEGDSAGPEWRNSVSVLGAQGEVSSQPNIVNFSIYGEYK